MASGRLSRANISGPIAFVAAGIVSSMLGEPEDVLALETEGLLVLTELTLALVLFSDAAEVPLRRLEHDAGLPSRLLVVGLPLTMLMGAVAAKALFPDLSWWVCAVIGAAVAPTDAALGAAIVEDERVPRRVRQVLNVESGLNDGIATPFVSFFLVAAVAGTAYEIESDARAIIDLIGGAVVGIAVGAAIGRTLTAARRRGWTEPLTLPLAAVASAIGAYAAADTMELNGFVAAFVGGLAFGAALPRDHLGETMTFARRIGSTLALFVWFLFGVLIVDPLGGITWREVLFAGVALTVVRMVPVAIALIRSGLDRSTVAVIGWFGPRGLASVVFALIAFETLPPDEASATLAVIGVTVLASVILHGATAAPTAARFGASHPSGALEAGSAER
jgi:NhaP-type Na+/H+ or K+/H+ antiporter